MVEDNDKTDIENNDKINIENNDKTNIENNHAEPNLVIGARLDLELSNNQVLPEPIENSKQAKKSKNKKKDKKARNNSNNQENDDNKIKHSNGVMLTGVELKILKS